MSSFIAFDRRPTFIMMWSVKILTTLQAIVCLGSSLQTNLTNPKGPLTQKHQTDSSAGDKSDHFLLYDRVENRQSDDTHSVLWRGISVRKEAAMLGEHLRELANNELGVTMIQVALHELNIKADSLNFSMFPHLTIHARIGNQSCVLKNHLIFLF